MSTPFDPLADGQDVDSDESTQDAEEKLPVLDMAELGASSEVDEGPAEPVSEAPVDPLVSTLPPEAQGETNGGPLGCCLGTVAGLFLTLSIIFFVSVAVGSGGYLGWATGPVALLGMLVGGYGGWRIGKLIYREYELSPERRERLERLDKQWNTHQRPSKQIRLPKTK